MDQLLSTKFYIPPRREQIVRRARLVRRLNAGLPRKLTLVSAPAGFGKTTLLAEWVAGLDAGDRVDAREGYRVAWLSLDENDNAPARFMAYLIAALRGVLAQGADFGQGSMAMLRAPQPTSHEEVLTPLINELAASPDRLVLALDDYHVIESGPVDAALNFLIEHLPPNLHLVVATRIDPSLPLSRLRARGQLSELRGADLRFTPAEAAEFLTRVMGLDLSEQQAAALEARTEGWIAGLQLAAISMQGLEDTAAFIRSFTGSHHYVLDYLIEEVLDRQPANMQAFMLRTAVLDRLCGPLCDALTGEADGQASLESFTRLNLFLIPLDEQRRWYRYHHLFADLLRRRLRQTREGEIPGLHRRAAEWFMHNGLVEEAIEHLLRAGETGRAAVVIEDNVDALWQRGDHDKLRRWMAALPSELVASRPHLCILRAWDLFTAGDLETAERILRDAENALDGLPGETAQAERDKILGRASALRAFVAFYRGEIHQVAALARQALELLPEQDLTWRSTATVALGDAYSFTGELEDACRYRREALQASQEAGNTYMALIAGLKLAVTLRQLGDLAQSVALTRQILQQAEAGGLARTIAAGWAWAVWGELLAEMNELDDALAYARKGTELTERGSDLAMISWSSLCLLRVLFSRGELDAAAEIVRKIESLARQYQVPPWVTNIASAWGARLWLARGKLEPAVQWALSRSLDPADELSLLREWEHVTLARILAAQGRHEDATRLLYRLLEAAETGGRTAKRIEILILLALSHRATGASGLALERLRTALALARPRGFQRIFVDEGPPMARLLLEMHSEAGEPVYVAHLVAVFPYESSSSSSKLQAIGDEIIEALSEREVEVLSCIAAGLTNREIGERLYLTLNTVKVHTRNIYSKLDVNNRTSAVARARVLGILPYDRSLDS